jgi:hypothetical protein
MAFKDKFKKLPNIFYAYYNDNYDCTDDETTREFASEIGEANCLALKSEIDEVLRMNSLPWEEIGNIANRHFEGESDCREWLLMIQKELDNVAPQSRRS